MRILVISDTHHRWQRLDDLLKGDHRFDRIFHLGDLVQDAEDIESVYGIPVDVVAGNCDWGNPGAPSNKIVEIMDKKFFLTHGHREHVKYGDSVLRQLIAEEGYDMVLYGHTHVAVLADEGQGIIMNPGSLSQPRDGGGPSFGVIHLDDKGKIHTNIVRLDDIDTTS